MSKDILRRDVCRLVSGVGRHVMLLVVGLGAACDRGEAERSPAAPPRAPRSPDVAPPIGPPFSGDASADAGEVPGPAVTSDAAGPDASETLEGINLTEVLLSDVTASTELRDGKMLYRADWATDGNHKTAWGAKRDQFRGEWLELSFSRPVTVTGLKLLTGFSSKSRRSGADLFPLNRRIKQAKITVGSAEGFIHDFADDSEWQTVPVVPPVKGDRVRLTILDVYQGTKYPDLHVSEVALWGTFEGEQSPPAKAVCSEKAVKAAIDELLDEDEEERLRKIAGIPRFYCYGASPDDDDAFCDRLSFWGYRIGRFTDAKCHEVFLSYGIEGNDTLTEEFLILRLWDSGLKVSQRFRLDRQCWERIGSGRALVDHEWSWLPMELVDFDHDGRQELLYRIPPTESNPCDEVLGALFRVEQRRMKLLFVHPVKQDALCAKKQGRAGVQGPPFLKTNMDLTLEDGDGDGVDEIIGTGFVHRQDASGAPIGEMKQEREVFRFNGTRFVKQGQ